MITLGYLQDSYFIQGYPLITPQDSYGYPRVPKDSYYYPKIPPLRTREHECDYPRIPHDYPSIPEDS